MLPIPHVLVAAAGRVPGVLLDEAREPDVWLVSFGDSSLNFELVVWVDRSLSGAPGRTQARLLWALEDELRVRNLTIPFPQRDLHIGSGALHVEITNPRVPHSVGDCESRTVRRDVGPADG